MNETQKNEHSNSEKMKVYSKYMRVVDYMDSSRVKKHLFQKEFVQENVNRLGDEYAKKNELIQAYEKNDKIYKRNVNHIFVQGKNHGTYIK